MASSTRRASTRRTRWWRTRSRRRRAEAETSFSRGPVRASMEDSEIPGSRGRASTGHGTLTVDELASIQPGMSRLMDELGRRYWALFYAAKAGNWELARYLERESEKILKAAAVVRLKYRDDLDVFSRDCMEPVGRAIEGRDWPAF